MSEALTFDNLIAGDLKLVAESVTVKLGSNLAKGTVLGKITKGTPTPAAKAGGNTGNGTCTALSLGTAPKLGVYQVRINGGEFAFSAKSDPVGTGNGVLTQDPTTPVLANAKAGVYKIVCIEPATDAGTFAVFDPDGVFLGRHVVGGAAFATQIKFTIADGSTDFAAGDYFTFTVVAAVPATGLGTFTVTDPDGVALATGVVGTPYAGNINFTLNDGATNFIVGDGFDITVPAGSGQVVIVNSTNVDGSQSPYAVLAEAVDATSAATVGVAYLTGEFSSTALVFGGADTVETHRTAMRALGIYPKTIQA